MALNKITFISNHFKHFATFSSGHVTNVFSDSAPHHIKRATVCKNQTGWNEGILNVCHLLTFHSGNFVKFKKFGHNGAIDFWPYSHFLVFLEIGKYFIIFETVIISLQFFKICIKMMDFWVREFFSKKGRGSAASLNWIFHLYLYLYLIKASDIHLSTLYWGTP